MLGTHIVFNLNEMLDSLYIQNYIEIELNITLSIHLDSFVDKNSISVMQLYFLNFELNQ